MRKLLLLFPLAAGAVVARAFLRVRRPAVNSPAAVVAHGLAGSPRVVCLGASTVRGNVSFNFVDELAARLPDRQWINAGMNGDTSAQILARLDDVVACRPDHVVVQVGANDVLKEVSLDTYEANLTAIVRRLRAETGAHVALMSIQVVGDRPDAGVNRELDRVNAIIRRAAQEHDVAYLPLNERLRDMLREHPGTGRDLPGSMMPVIRGIVLRLGLGVGLDRIGRLNGYAIHTDGLHLATPAGMVAAGLVEEFVLR
ncbi:MAG TPA: GDSL-type esterase/lipase family protein [Actinophytocola sp.]|uniref:SGNH/GDSL hydrolase family protein n=1 Tax=Actinophytocola sp. TaxID=1872138 RepID=UPI002F953605